MQPLHYGGIRQLQAYNHQHTSVYHRICCSDLWPQLVHVTVCSCQVVCAVDLAVFIAVLPEAWSWLGEVGWVVAHHPGMVGCLGSVSGRLQDIEGTDRLLAGHHSLTRGPAAAPSYQPGRAAPGC